jgi:hypothetical protein
LRITHSHSAICAELVFLQHPPKGSAIFACLTGCTTDIVAVFEKHFGNIAALKVFNHVCPGLLEILRSRFATVGIINDTDVIWENLQTFRKQDCAMDLVEQLTHVPWLVIMLKLFQCRRMEDFSFETIGRAQRSHEVVCQ